MWSCAITILLTIVADTCAVTICNTPGVSQVTAQESNTHGWKVYFPDPRKTAYNGGAIPKTHYDGLSKLLNLTNKVIMEKLVGNAAAGAKILTKMQKTPIVFSSSGMGWSISGMIGSCNEAINTGCVLGQNYPVIADHYLSFATYTSSSTTLSSMLLHELAHVFDRSLLVNEASFDAQYGNKPNGYSLARTVRAAYTGSQILVVKSSGENLVSQAKIEALGYDVITHAQNDVCSKGQYYCGSGGSAGKWLQGQSAAGVACAQKTKSKCFVGNPAGPNDGKDDYAFSTSLEYFAELTESITQGTVVDGSTMGQNDKWPYNNANLQAEDSVGFAAVSAMWKLTEAEFDAAVAMKCPAQSTTSTTGTTGTTGTSGTTGTEPKSTAGAMQTSLSFSAALTALAMASMHAV